MTPTTSGVRANNYRNFKGEEYDEAAEDNNHKE